MSPDEVSPALLWAYQLLSVLMDIRTALFYGLAVQAVSAGMLTLAIVFPRRPKPKKRAQRRR